MQFRTVSIGLLITLASSFLYANDKVIKPELYVFVSFSMPEQSLRALAQQSDKLGGTLVLRGFYENSIQKTSKKVNAIFGEKAISEFKVDPESFHRFQISIVPSVVVVNEQNHFDVVSGDISLEAALERIISKGSPEVRYSARKFLDRSHLQALL